MRIVRRRDISKALGRCVVCSRSLGTLPPQIKQRLLELAPGLKVFLDVDE